jgi:tRNA threonylcarbamoyladenosine biosynthesis protein TsaB
VNVLGIETSSEVCSVGFVNEAGVRIERSLVDPHIHSEKLLTLVGEVLTQVDANLRSVDAVAVSIGPGSFTGLRIGLSTAKGLCYAVGCRLVAVPTFAGVAASAHEAGCAQQALIVIVDARQGEFYVGSIENNNRQSALSIVVETKSLEQLSKEIVPELDRCCITDRPDTIRSLGVREELIASYSSFCKGDSVARLGIGKVRAQDFADLASIEPMYLKDFVVKTAIT